VANSNMTSTKSRLCWSALNEVSATINIYKPNSNLSKRKDGVDGSVTEIALSNGQLLFLSTGECLDRVPSDQLAILAAFNTLILMPLEIYKGLICKLLIFH
jgi:hypothetical protein